MEQYQEIYDILERKRSAKRGHFIIRVMTGTPFTIIHLSPPPPSSTLPDGGPLLNSENLHLSRSSSVLASTFTSPTLFRMKWRDSLLTKYLFENVARTPIIVGKPASASADGGKGGWRWYGRTDGRIPTTALTARPTTGGEEPKQRKARTSKIPGRTIKTNVPTLNKSTKSTFKKSAAPSFKKSFTNTSKNSLPSNSCPPSRKGTVSALISSTLTPTSAVRCRDLIRTARTAESEGFNTEALGMYKGAREYLGDYEGLSRKIDKVERRIMEEGKRIEEMSKVEETTMQAEPIKSTHKGNLDTVEEGTLPSHASDEESEVDVVQVLGEFGDGDDTIDIKNLLGGKWEGVKNGTPRRVKTDEQMEEEEEKEGGGKIMGVISATNIVNTPMKNGTPMRVKADEQVEEEEEEEVVGKTVGVMHATNIVNTPMKNATPMRVKADEQVEEEEEVSVKTKVVIPATNIVKTPMKNATPMRVKADEQVEEEEEVAVKTKVFMPASNIVKTPMKNATPMRVKADEQMEEEEEVVSKIKGVMHATNIVKTPMKNATPMRVKADEQVEEEEEEEVTESAPTAANLISKIVKTPMKNATPLRVVANSQVDEEEEEVAESVPTAANLISKIVKTPMKNATPLRVVANSQVDEEDEEEVAESAPTAATLISKIVKTPMKNATPLRVVANSQVDEEEEEEVAENAPTAATLISKIVKTPMKNATPLRVVANSQVDEEEEEEVAESAPTAANLISKIVKTPMKNATPLRVVANSQVDDDEEEEEELKDCPAALSKLASTPLKGSAGRVEVGSSAFSDEDFLPSPQAPLVEEETAQPPTPPCAPTPPGSKEDSKEKTRLGRTPLKGKPARVALEVVEEGENAAGVVEEEGTEQEGDESDPLLKLLNFGDAEALLELPGVGAKRAANIIKRRSEGAFKEAAELKSVGITKKGVDKIMGMFKGGKENVKENENVKVIKGEGGRRRSRRSVAGN
ncbi:hypothetical protein TrCOL_g11501 [Triparma columacea]|uniref:Uncharacterized protein n=1 Tax=Triparma columacea TaxID=722753 RepID=A0A9W7GB57_9STRA|nr:hypothetical protein TrCOL_g11501 [Triparma columacea]